MYDGLKDNKNAEKWTEENVIAILSGVYDKSAEPDCYLQEIAYRNILTKGQWDYIGDKYKDNKTVSGTIKGIKANCQINLTSAMLQGKVKETASIFLLKAIYGLVDKQVLETEHKGSININLQLPDEIQDTD
jgi:hypothetical protein